MTRTFTTPEHWLRDRVNVALVGAGGTGSQLADQLASLDATLRRLDHPGLRVVVFDGDRVSPSNLGRSRFAAPDVGLHKSTVLVHRLRAFYGSEFIDVPAHFGRDDLLRSRIAWDLVITATDSAAFRVKLAKWGASLTRPLWIDLGNRASDGQVVIGHLGSKVPDRLPHVVDLYRAELSGEAGRQADEELPSCGTAEAIARQEWPVNRAAASIAADMIWQLFRAGRITHHAAHFKTSPLQVVPMAIDPATWAFFGYEATPNRRRKRASCPAPAAAAPVA